MKNIKQKTALALSICALSLSAYAANPGVYMGLGAGYSYLENFSDIRKDKENNLGGKLFVGYNFNKYFGLEASYVAYGDTKYHDQFNYRSYLFDVTMDYQLRAFDLVSKFYLPINENDKNSSDIYVLVGLANAMADAKATMIVSNYNSRYTQKDHFSHNETVGVIGLGINYHINDHIATGLEYTFTGGTSGDDNNIGIPRSNLTTLNLIYKI